VSILRRVSRFARRHELWRPDTRLIAAVSGGSDSVALLVLLNELHLRGDLVLDAVAHVHHGIRGHAADEDERYCRELAARLDRPFVCAHVDVPALARRRRQSIEVAGREARRGFFDSVRRDRGADVVATAHTQDDQAETVLLRLVRGSGVRGLGGISPASAHLVRPLLACNRGELRAELISRGQAWREDATNAELSTPRNRVRLELLPYLEQHFNPSVRAGLARLADLARADEAALDRQAAAATLHLLHIDESGVGRLNASGLLSVPEAVSGRIVQRVLETLSEGAPGAEDVTAVLDVAANERRAAELLGLRAEHSEGFVVLLKKGPAPGPAPSFRLNLPIPGSVLAPDAAWILEAEGPCVRHVGSRTRVRADQVEIEAAGLGRSLIVRSREPGDRVRPLGATGRKKVQDVFVDRKVARLERDQVPLVTDDRGRIVWVAGHVLGEDFKVTDSTKAVIILKLRRLGRLGTGPAAPGDPAGRAR
jgi:tRNA(Ile)-lysidine synthase